MVSATEDKIDRRVWCVSSWVMGRHGFRVSLLEQGAGPMIKSHILITIVSENSRCSDAITTSSDGCLLS